MEPALRDGTLTVRELLWDSFRLLPRNLNGLGLLLGAELVGLLLRQLIQHPEEHAFLLRVIDSCVSAIGLAAFLSWTHAQLLQEPERSPFAALRVGLRRFPALALMGLLFLTVLGGGRLMVLNLLGLYIALRMSLVAPLLVLEGRGPLQALRDSFTLTRVHWRPLLVVLAVMVCLSVLCEVAGSFVLFFLSREFGEMALVGRGLDPFFRSGLHAIASALFYTPILLAWLRISRIAPLSI